MVEFPLQSLFALLPIFENEYLCELNETTITGFLSQEAHNFGPVLIENKH